MKITKEMMISEVIEKKPEAIQTLFDIGLGCVGCHMAAEETLEQGCLAHGINHEEIDKLVERINK